MKKKSFLKSAVKTVLITLLALFVALNGFMFASAYIFKSEYETYDTTNSNITEYGKTLVSAHRSGGGIFPENTMMAFEGCINSKDFKTDIFEFDLHITGDDELIILHDSTLDRTTDAELVFGKEDIHPEDYTYEEISKLNFGEDFENSKGEMPYKGLHGDDVPANLRASRLDEVLDYLQNNGDFGYIIEIKNSGDLGKKAADILYDTLKERELLGKVVVGTFNNDVTLYLDEAYPDMKRSASIKEVAMVYFLSLFGIDKKDFKFDALQIPSGYSILRLDTVRLVNYAHRHNIAVQYWTINDKEQMAHLRDIGADCIMSDIPDVAYNVLNR